MVEFEFQPWKKIVVHEVVKFPLEHFLISSSLGVQQGSVGQPLTWSNGFIFEKDVFRDTDDVVREKLGGKIHWTYLHYAIVEEYQPEFKVAGNIRIPVINLSDHETFKEMATWIENNFEKREK